MLAPALTVAAYLVGSISFGLLEASRRGVDLRSIGSGNVGATNAARALGRSTGRKVLLLDMLKGLLPVALARWVLELSWPWISAVGMAAAVGHCFPVWHGFRGGKGAATAGGVLLGALPLIGLVTLATWASVKKISRRASVASLSAATVGAGLAVVRYGTDWPGRLAVGLWVLIVIRHASNIGRLLRGEEPAG